MRNLGDLILSNEDWLMNRVLHYAKERDFVKYTSTLAEAWRTSIVGLSRALIDSIKIYSSPPELSPDDDFLKDPIATFGVLEARRHRSRGITLSMFLGLMKYYRQSYVDLVIGEVPPGDVADRFRLYVDRFFDRVELAFISEWSQQSENDLVADLQTANRAITNEKNRYLTIFESLADPVILLSPDNQIKNMNYAARKLFNAEVHPGAAYYRHESRVEPVGWLFEELGEFNKQNKTESHFEKTIKMSDSIFHFEVSFENMLDVSGKFSGVIVTLRDVTERRRADEALRESEERFRTIFEQGPLGVVIADLNYKWININRKFSEITGYSAEELQQLTFVDITHPDDLESDVAQAQALARGDIPYYQMEKRYIKKDGEITWINLSTNLLRDSLERPVYYMGMIEDINSRKKIETEKEHLAKSLFELQKMEALGTLVGGIAHDFNNMLQIIILYAENLDSRLEKEKKPYAELDTIFRTAEEAAELVKNLLAFAQKAPVFAKPLDVNDQVVEVTKLLSRTLPDFVHVDLELTDGPAMIRADRNLINQIIVNLALNGSEAMPNGGRLTISTRNVTLDDELCGTCQGTCSGEYVMLSVSDNGHGMSRETLSKIYDPFFSTKERGSRRGTGLGLSVVKGIVQQHGGHMSCKSDPGMGSEFNLYFPSIDSRLSTLQQLEPVQFSRTGPQTVLVVEDNPDVAGLEKMILTNAGYDVIVAPNGREALNIYRNKKVQISLVILDLVMPDINGKDCLKEMLKIDPTVKVLVLSAHSEEDPIGRDVSPHVLGFLRKPCRMPKLLDAVHKGLNRDLSGGYLN